RSYAYGKRYSTPVNPARAAAANRSRKSTSLNSIVRLAASLGMGCRLRSRGSAIVARRRGGVTRFHASAALLPCRVPRRAGPASELDIAFPDAIEIALLELLEIQQLVLRIADSPDDLVQLDLYRLGVAVLRALDQKHHQEGHDRRSRVDDELPGIAEPEQRTRDGPHDDDQYSQDEGARPAGRVRCPFRQS